MLLPYQPHSCVTSAGSCILAIFLLLLLLLLFHYEMCLAHSRFLSNGTFFVSDVSATKCLCGPEKLHFPAKEASASYSEGYENSPSQLNTLCIMSL